MDGDEQAVRLELSAVLRMIEASAGIARNAVWVGHSPTFHRELDGIVRYLDRARKLQEEVKWKR